LYAEGPNGVGYLPASPTSGGWRSLSAARSEVSACKCRRTTTLRGCATRFTTLWPARFLVHSIALPRRRSCATVIEMSRDGGPGMDIQRYTVRRPGGRAADDPRRRNRHHQLLGGEKVIPLHCGRVARRRLKHRALPRLGLAAAISASTAERRALPPSRRRHRRLRRAARNPPNASRWDERRPKTSAPRALYP